MAPFDGHSGVPPNGGPPGSRGMQGPGQAHTPQHNPQGMMHAPPPYPYQHRGSVGMPPGQPGPHGMPPQSPAASRQGSFNAGMHGGPGGYSGHPPLHSPHQSGGMPPHPAMAQQMHAAARNGHLGGSQHSAMSQQMPHNSHDAMRNASSNNSHSRHQQYMNNSSNSGGGGGGSGGNNSGGGSMSAGGNWQTDKDTPHRREMIQHMYVAFVSGFILSDDELHYLTFVIAVNQFQSKTVKER